LRSLLLRRLFPVEAGYGGVNLVQSINWRVAHSRRRRPARPQFAFRGAPATVAAIRQLQALLADRRGAPVSKAAAITFAVERAVLDLTEGDPVERMTSIELRERQAKVRHEIDEEVTIERGGDLEILHVHMGVFNPTTGKAEPLTKR
jgi:hypothetical protein